MPDPAAPSVSPAAADRVRSSAPPRVVIVGSGFGGLFAARALAPAPVQVTVIDRTNHHLFQPLLYQVATGILSSGEIAPPTRDVLRHQRNTVVLQGDVEEVDTRSRVVRVRPIDDEDLTEVPFDYLIAATGVTQSYFGNDSFRENTLSMKSLADALALREQIFRVLEQAEWEQDPAARSRQLTFAVVGAGPTGVELAGQLGELAHRSLHGNFRRFNPAAMRVVLLDAGPRILPAYSERQSRMAANALERLGIELHMNAQVVTVDRTGIEYRSGGSGGERVRIEAATRVWAAGVDAAGFSRRLAEAAGAPLDRHGRIEVLGDCSVPDFPNIFAVGDMMALRDLPGLAEVAMQTGVHAAKMIRADLSGRPRRRFRYLDLGSMAAVSRTSAVASFHGIQINGLIGWLMWLCVHLFFLTGFKNRVTTVIHWGVTFLGRARSERGLTLAVGDPGPSELAAIHRGRTDDRVRQG